MALAEWLEALTCPQSKLVIGKFCGDSVQRMEIFLGRRLPGQGCGKQPDVELLCTVSSRGVASRGDLSPSFQFSVV